MEIKAGFKITPSWLLIPKVSRDYRPLQNVCVISLTIQMLSKQIYIFTRKERSVQQVSPFQHSFWLMRRLVIFCRRSKNKYFLVPQWVSILCPHQTHCRMFIFKNRLQKWNTLLFSLYHFSITAAWNWIVNIKCMLASTSRGHTSAARTSLTSKCGLLGAHGTQCPSDLRRRIWLRRPFALLIVYVFNSDTTPVLC